jgi:flagellar biosynthesis protein FliQ
MLTVPELLLLSYRLYRKYFWTLLGYTAWLLLPSTGLLALKSVQPFHQNTWWFIPAVLCVMVGIIFLGLWITIILTKFSASLIEGKKTSHETLQQNSWNLIPPLLIVSILQAVAIVGGFLLLIIPGIIFLVWYAFAQFNLILDNTRGVQSLSQSRQLVKGRFLEVFWKLLSGPLIITLLYSSVLAILITIIGLATGVEIDPLFGQEAPLWVNLLETITNVLLTPLIMLYLTLLYIELKKHPATKPVENTKHVA